MIRMTKFEMLLVGLFTFCVLAVGLSETRSSPALTFGPDEETGFFKIDPDGPSSVHLSGSEVVLRLCISGLPPELINVRFGDGKSLNNFPINATIHLPINRNNPLPVSTKILSRPENITESRIGNRNESGNRIENETGSVNESKTSTVNKIPDLTSDLGTPDSSTTNLSSEKKGAEASEKSPSGLVASCPTIIRHSYANPGLYRIEAEIVRPKNLTLTISPAWIRISSFEFLVGQVLLFNQTDRLITLETARFLAAVRDLQLSLVAEVDFGDNTPTKGVELHKSVSVPEWVPKVPWLVNDYRTGSCDHAYAYPGTYTITLQVSRYQKGIAETEVVIAQTTLTVETFTQRIGDHLLFYQPGVRTFPRENFEVVAMVERLPSENTRVDLDFGDGSPLVSVQLERTTPRPEWTRLNETDHYYWTLVRHRFSLSGSFQMKMIVSRTDLSESRVVFFCPVVVYDFLVDVKDVRLLLSVAEGQGQGQNKVTRGESVMFIILIRSRPEADLEVLVDFGDGTEQQKINYTTDALASLPHDALYDLPDANHVGFAHHTYSSKGTFEAKVFVTNIELKRFREATFTAGTVVRVMTCSNLPVWIGGTGVQRSYGRWEEIVLDAHVAPGCEDEIGGARGARGGRGGGEGGGDTGASSDIKEGEEEAIGAGKIEAEGEGRETEGTSEREETGGEGGGGGGGGGRKRKWRKEDSKGLLAEWRIVRVGSSSVAGTAWMTHPKSSGFEIHFPSYSLPVGEYEFQIQLTRLSLDDSTPIGRTVNKTKVIISSMHFKVDVEPETQRIDLSTGSVAVFKALIVPEMDWDDLDQPILYEWFCVTQKLSDDDLDPQDDSGCYGDKSKMDGTTSLLGIEPKRLVFETLPAVYYVYARATRSDRTVTSLPAEVWLDAKSDLIITVVCLINCDAFLSPNETLTLSYTCSNCNRLSNPFSHFSILSSSSDSSSSSSHYSSPSSYLTKDRNLNFSWTLEPSGTGIDLTRNSLTGSNSDWLIIPGLAFYEKLTLENQTHHIKLTVTDGLFSQGTASYAVSVSARLKPSLLARGDPTSRASSLLVLSQRHLLFCVTIMGILLQMTSLRYRT